MMIKADIFSSAGDHSDFNVLGSHPRPMVADASSYPTASPTPRGDVTARSVSTLDPKTP
jgi:hypothetical protein